MTDNKDNKEYELDDSVRSRKYFITSFPTIVPEDIQGYTYVLVGQETCPTTGRPHWHVYIEFKHQQTVKRMKKMFPGANIQLAKGSAEQNKVYLSKQNLIFEKGTPSQQQGKRNDLDELMNDIKEGKNDEHIYDTHPMLAAKYHKFIEKYRNLKEEKRNWVTECIALYGPPGSGKTRRAVEEGGVFVEYNNGFFQGYEGEDVVIFDEFDWRYMPRGTFLKLTDRYAYKVNVKGGSRNWKPRKIFFISNDEEPSLTWYNGDPAMLRRLKFVDIETYLKGGW